MTAVARSACLNENEVLALLRGGLGENARTDAHAHIDACDACQQVLACVLDASGFTVDVSRSGPAVAGIKRKAAVLPGQMIGRYRVREAIGSGAMGIVYLAEDPALVRTVAVKVHRHQDAAASERLLREARSLARLSHPNVIVVHEVGTFEDNVFMAMEFVDGSSLTSWLAEKPRSTEEIVEVFVQAGRGLAVAHAAGLVHRDFKPDNVLVGRDGRVRVVDFGLAREELFLSMEKTSRLVDALARTELGDASLTRTGTVVGTPAYMAPEQYAGKQADARSDQFAFAVSLFEGLYDQRPFVGDTLARLERAVSSGLVVIPRTSRRVPKNLAKALIRSLRPDPEKRFASMDDLLVALTKSERGSGRYVMAAGALAFGAAAIFVATARFGHEPRAAAVEPQPIGAEAPTQPAPSALPVPTSAVAAPEPPLLPAASASASAGARAKSAKTGAKLPSAKSKVVGARPSARTPEAAPSAAELFDSIQ